MIIIDFILLSGFLVFLIAFMAGYTVGYAIKISTAPTSDYVLAYPTNSNTPVMLKKPNHQDKPGGIFKDPVFEPSGPVQRPSVRQLNEWHKPEKKKAEEAAMHETFSAIPELKSAKDFISSQRKEGV